MGALCRDVVNQIELAEGKCVEVRGLQGLDSLRKELYFALEDVGWAFFLSDGLKTPGFFELLLVCQRIEESFIKVGPACAAMLGNEAVEEKAADLNEDGGIAGTCSRQFFSEQPNHAVRCEVNEVSLLVPERVFSLVSG